MGNCGIGVDVGVGVGEGAPSGVVGLGMVVLWAIPVLGAAFDRELIEIVAISGTKNKIESVKIR